jgi:hypothetical protein
MEPKLTLVKQLSGLSQEGRLILLWFGKISKGLCFCLP